MRAPADDVAPTMLIPRGTRIELDADGQLSIHAPGNLVVQSSGKYGTLESMTGSIRIDRGAEVEAVTVRCADTCYVQGFLTAWKVSARSLQLEGSARAHVVLQETQRLEIGRDARLVGNFSSEKELFGLFSRFAHQLRSIPLFFDRRQAPAELPPAREDQRGERSDRHDRNDETIDIRPPGKPASQLPEPLLLAMVLLEREAERRIHPIAAQRALDQLIELLQQQDLDTLEHTWRLLFRRIAEPREHVKRAYELVGEHYADASAQGS